MFSQGLVSLASIQAGTYTKYNLTSRTLTSLSEVMLGDGADVSFTPSKTGTILVIFMIPVANSVGGDGALIASIRYGTGAAPANGDATTGTDALVLLDLFSYSNPTANLVGTLTVMAVITGLTLNTAYWIDVGAAALVGGTATFQRGKAWVIEATK